MWLNLKAPEPPPPMHPFKLLLYLLLMVIAGALAMLVKRRGLTDQMTTEAMISVMTTLLVISLVELIPEVIRKRTEHSKIAKFTQFFGNAAMTDKVRLVFPYRELKPHLVDPWNASFQVHEINGVKPVPEGVNTWVPTHDIRAAVSLANLFRRFADKDVCFSFDRDITDDDFDYCAIAIGLGFNGFTYRLSRWCDGGLFIVKYGESVKHSFTQPTDNFALAGCTTPSPPERKDDAIIARIVTAKKPKRVCFVCAGRTAQGTAAAGYFLNNNWEEIFQIYQDKSLDLSKSLAVVVRHTADESVDMEFLDPELAKDDRGNIICQSR